MNLDFFSFRKRLALFTPALIDVRPIFKNGVIRAGVKGACVKKGPAEKGPIRYFRVSSTTLDNIPGNFLTVYI